MFGRSKNAKRGNSEANRFVPRRRRMVDTQLIPRAITDERVLDAMNTVPREEFVPQSMQDDAYADCALPIDKGQTISQPFTVAFMVQALQLSGQDKVLEIGTGSGYQTAVLSCLAQQVYSVEKISQLAEAASRRLSDQGYSNIHIRCSNGYFGWPEEAPYDAIIVTAGAPEIPTVV